MEGEILSLTGFSHIGDTVLDVTMSVSIQTFTSAKPHPMCCFWTEGKQRAKETKRDSIGSEIIPSQEDNYLIFSIGYGKEGQEKWKGMWKEEGGELEGKGVGGERRTGRKKEGKRWASVCNASCQGADVTTCCLLRSVRLYIVDYTRLQTAERRTLVLNFTP